MLVIQDEQLSEQLKQIASREQRPVEEILKALLAHYPQESDISVEDKIKVLRRSAYIEARHHWQETGDIERANLTDEALDEQFWLFDSEGIPRLKADEDSVELVPGTSAWLAAHIDELAFDVDTPLDAERADDILNAEFADYILRKQRNGSATNSGG